MVKISVPDDFCKGCVWLVDGQLCPFPGKCMKDLGMPKGENHE